MASDLAEYQLHWSYFNYMQKNLTYLDFWPYSKANTLTPTETTLIFLERLGDNQI